MNNNEQQLKRIFNRIVELDEEEIEEKKEEPKQLKKAFIREPKKKSPNEKMYTILYYMYDDNGDEIKTFEEIKGRKDTYEFIKSLIECIDVDKSKVMVENVFPKDAVSVYEFMEYATQFYDDKFEMDEIISRLHKIE